MIPIVLGMVIYLLTRPDTYISQWIYHLGISVSDPGRGGVLPKWLWMFLCNFSADMLWAYSLAFAVYLILCDHSKYMPITLVICLTFETGIELLQLLGLINGTFDWWDIALEICATAMASLIIKNTRRKHYEKI